MDKRLEFGKDHCHSFYIDIEGENIEIGFTSYGEACYWTLTEDEKKELFDAFKMIGQERHFWKEG